MQVKHLNLYLTLTFILEMIYIQMAILKIKLSVLLHRNQTPIMKKLTFSQGKLLIKLVNRQTDSSSYELVKAFMGPFKAGFYQTFAALFGASLKKEYHPEGEDRLTERVVLLVENGQI